MKKSVKLPMTILCAAVFLCSVLCAVLYSVACRTSLDTAILHFNDSPLVTAMVAMFIATPVLCLAAGLVMWRKASVTAIPESTVFVNFATTFAGLLLICTAVMTFVEHRGTIFYRSKLLILATAVFAILSGVYFLLFRGNGKTLTARMWLSLAPVLWGLCLIMNIYFDTERTINDPIKSLYLTLCAVHVIFLCEDIRFYIGIQSAAVYYFIALAASFTSIAIAIPNLILTYMKTPTFDFSVLETTAFIALGMFALARLASLPAVLGEYIKPEKKKDAVEEAKAAIDAAEKKLAETEASESTGSTEE